MEGRVLEKWCGGSFQPVMWDRHLFVEALQQARFADAGLADHQHHLPLALKRVFPTIIKQAQFVLTPDERGQPADCGGGFKPSSHSARLNYPVKLERPFDAF